MKRRPPSPPFPPAAAARRPCPCVVRRPPTTQLAPLACCRNLPQARDHSDALRGTPRGQLRRLQRPRLAERALRQRVSRVRSIRGASGISPCVQPLRCRRHHGHDCDGSSASLFGWRNGSLTQTCRCQQLRYESQKRDSCGVPKQGDPRGASGRRGAGPPSVGSDAGAPFCRLWSTIRGAGDLRSFRPRWTLTITCAPSPLPCGCMDWCLGAPGSGTRGAPARVPGKGHEETPGGLPPLLPRVSTGTRPVMAPSHARAPGTCHPSNPFSSSRAQYHAR